MLFNTLRLSQCLLAAGGRVSVHIEAALLGLLRWLPLTRVPLKWPTRPQTLHTPYIRSFEKTLVREYLTKAPFPPSCCKDAVVICTLGTGTSFGESILDNTPRHATIVTREFTELLRIEQREFRTLWEVSLPVCTCPAYKHNDGMKSPKNCFTCLIVN